MKIYNEIVFDIDGNVRGISTLLPWFDTDDSVHAIIIRSNTAGDVINFKYYDA